VRTDKREDGAVDRDEEFSEYVATRWPRLVRSAVLLGCAPAEAEDVVQTALTRCLINWAKVRRADDRDAYVHRVLINAFISSRRRRWSVERAVASVPDLPGEDATAASDSADALQRSLERLTPEQRACVVLRYYAHLTESQMADVLGIAPGTVKSRLSRALKVLAKDPNLADLRGAP
jgi:RNA polymerase sigma-70 factor (sigma-E family)